MKNSLELKISYFLRGGLSVAGLFLLSGWVGMLLKGRGLEDLSVYRPQPMLDSLKWAIILKDAPYILSILGLVILVSLPIIRVLLTGLLFFKQKEFLLAGMAFFVFTVLILGAFLGIR